MLFLITFLEGVVTFVSPCLLPMLPLYLAYFAGSSTSAQVAGASEGARTRRVFANALGFVLGFTLVFVALGAFAGGFGGVLARHATVLNIVCGLVVVVFGLSFAGVLRIPVLERTLKPQARIAPSTFPAAVLFGIVFSIGWTPCVGAYLGSALLLASTQGSVALGMALLLVYSAGLGIPFVVSALAVDKLAGAFDFVKRNYTTVNRVCGFLLVVIGVLMMTGLMNVVLSALGRGF